jgi:UDP-3-O-[3-hydroxymyristoyl] glucosamine N-acyltransferase
MTVAEFAERLGAELRPGAGEDLSAIADTTVTGLNGIETARPTEITFVANQVYARLAPRTRAAAIIVEPEFVDLPVPTLRIANPYLAWARAIELIYPAMRYAPGIHPTAAIDPSATLGSGVHIGAYAVISEGCTVGQNTVILAHTVLYPGASVGARCLIHAHAVIRENCRLGDEVILQNGVVIGGDGFGFAKDASGRWRKIQQPAPTVLEDRVEVQTNSCIDRASVGETRIGAGTKVDNLVQVGHGSIIGEDALLCAQVGLAGSTILGNKVILAGQVGVSGHLTMGDGSIATAQSGVGMNIAPGAVVSGSPSMDNRIWLRMVTSLPRLPELMRRVKALENRLGPAPQAGTDPSSSGSNA